MADAMAEILGPSRTIDYPEDWGAQAPQGMVPVRFDDKVYTDTETGAKCLMFHMAASDGTVLGAVAWRTGRRFFRMRPETHWAIEERFEGRLTRRSKRLVEQLWRILVDSCVEANRKAKEEFDG